MFLNEELEKPMKDMSESEIWNVAVDLGHMGWDKKEEQVQELTNKIFEEWCNRQSTTLNFNYATMPLEFVMQGMTSPSTSFSTHSYYPQMQTSYKRIIVQIPERVPKALARLFIEQIVREHYSE